ncbi:MAG: hypothetical protein K0Q79_3745 [Flavipsychrobacter sp.]|nr:hypothetical protein [Flavipsychrobacter sp.]
MDGSSLGAVTTYTFTAVSAAHTISAAFAPDCTAPAVTASATNVTCNGGANGTLTATATGTATLAYSWSNGATTSSVSGIAAGTYTVTVTNACGSATATATVGQPSAISFSATATQPTCSYNTGSVALASSGGTGSISYSGSATSGLTTGSYSYTATDANGCTATSSATITNPSAISFSATVTQPTCSYNTGSVTLASSGGTGTISYSGAATSGLTTGSYSYTATDANGCTASHTVTITNPSEIVVSASVTNVSCFGGSNGAVVVSAAGGTGTLSGTGTYSGLSAGSYSYTVTDANGCTATTSGSITHPSAALIVSATAANVSCNSANGGNHSNGSIATSVSGGTASYSYSWSGGASPSGLSIGTYSVTVTDAQGCTAATAATVSQPSAMSASLTASNVSCHTSNGSSHSNGSISSSVSGGTSSYTYAWSNSQTGATNTGLSIGTYSVTVTDANSCTTTGSATVGQPSVLTLSWTGSAPHYTTVSTCSAGYAVLYGYDDTLTTSVSGGTGTKTYYWSGGTTNTTGMLTLPSTGTAPSTYTVSVTDANGCTSSRLSACVVDVRCSTPGNTSKTQVCKKSKTICVDDNALAAQLASGATVGPCGSWRHGNDENSIANAGVIKVYPNPTEGIINIEIPVANKTADIIITDVAGRVVDQRSITDNKGEVIQFNLSDVAKGMYLVKIVARDEPNVTKVIVR